LASMLFRAAKADLSSQQYERRWMKALSRIYAEEFNHPDWSNGAG
jgi:hypothetical protein